MLGEPHQPAATQTAQDRGIASRHSWPLLVRHHPRPAEAMPTGCSGPFRRAHSLLSDARCYPDAELPRTFKEGHRHGCMPRSADAARHAENLGRQVRVREHRDDDGVDDDGAGGQPSLLLRLQVGSVRADAGAASESTTRSRENGVPRAHAQWAPRRPCAHSLGPRDEISGPVRILGAPSRSGRVRCEIHGQPGRAGNVASAMSSPTTRPAAITKTAPRSWILPVVECNKVEVPR